MQLHLVTTVNERLWNEYGYRFAREFSEHSDGSVVLTVIFETRNMQPLPAVSLPSVQLFPLKHEGHARFLAYFGNLWEANGHRLVHHTENGQIKGLKLIESYRFNAVRFSFKPFALDQFRRYHSHKNIPFAWIDADMRVISGLSAQKLLEFIPAGGQLMSYLGRDNHDNLKYSECGFLGFNGGHDMLPAFFERMCGLYTSGEIFSQQEWHDSWLWDVVRREFDQTFACEFKNISLGFDHLAHPFINTRLGLFFDHLKGPERKASGYSFDSDRADGNQG